MYLFYLLSWLPVIIINAFKLSKWIKKTLECSLSRGQALQGPSNSTVFVCVRVCFFFFPCNFFLESPVSVQSGSCALCPLLNCCPEKKKKSQLGYTVWIMQRPMYSILVFCTNYGIIWKLTVSSFYAYWGSLVFRCIVLCRLIELLVFLQNQKTVDIPNSEDIN